MKEKYQNFITIVLLMLFVVPSLALAHQPRLTETRETVVSDPEISKAYYGKLTGMPDIYVINANAPFNFYVNILVPDIEGQKKDISVDVLKNGTRIAELDGLNFHWKRFYEPFGVDTYWMGPEYKMRTEAGDYEIRVYSPSNEGKYSLAIGETEAFDFKETINAVSLIPKLKRDFFNESPISFVSSPFGLGLIVTLYLLAWTAGLIYIGLINLFTKGEFRGMHKNIGTGDRWLRFAISTMLLVWAITTSWNPVIIFLSGFAFFEAIFSWCGLYAALGKNTCKI